MVKKIKRLLAIGLVCAYTNSNAQDVNVGDTVPDIRLGLTENKELRFSDLRGKLVILDFWAHTCAACIRAFGKMDSLQKLFGDRIQIILVNPESKEATDRFFAARKKLKKPELPFVSGDTVLQKMFPHYSVPYHVWIDSGGTVRYTTMGANTNKKSILNFLNGNYFMTRNYKRVQYVPSLIDEQYRKLMEFHSYLSHCSIGNHLTAERREGYEQIAMKCASVVELYQRAYNGSENLNYKFNRPGRMILNVEDSLKYVRPANDEQKNEWYTNYSYDYHLLLPEEQADKKYALMKADLSRYFGLVARVETRPVECLVLVRTSKENKLKSKGGKPEKSFYWTELGSTQFDSVRYMVNQPYADFSTDLSYYIENYFLQAFVDQTGFSGNIDIRISDEALDAYRLDLLRKELRKYDLDIVKKKVPLQVILLSESKRKE
jgi:thiol-disulfide isomerase/thioredoxin